MCYFLQNSFNFVQIDLSDVIDIHFVQPVHKGLGHVIPAVMHYHRRAVHVVNLQLVLMKDTDMLLSTIHKVSIASFLLVTVACISGLSHCPLLLPLLQQLGMIKAPSHYLVSLPLPVTALYDKEYK